MTRSPPSQYTVLLVEDYRHQLTAWARELEADGRRVLLAATAAEAVRHAETDTPDIAIVDLFLGADDALECVARLKQIVPELAVVVVSGDMSVAYAMASVRAGADEVLVKPLDVVEVVHRIEDGTAGEVRPLRTNLTLDQVEWEHISRALLESGKNITQAAERLGIYRQTLQRKLRKRERDRAGTQQDP